VFGADIGLDGSTPVDQLRGLREQFDWIRRTLTSEPRGPAFAVGAVVSRPSTSSDRWSTVFFNNVGYLGMCGHGLIGVVEALRYRGLIEPGRHEFLTPPGAVVATLGEDHHVEFTGVRSYCLRQDVTVTFEGGRAVGDVAYGGNWFFLSRDESIRTSSTDELEAKCQRIRVALQREGIRGADDVEIDHIELYGALHAEEARSPGSGSDEGREIGCRNFVLCPGGHYDRSPCGTGTSAKLACLAARGELAPGQRWIQESSTGSRFMAFYQVDPAVSEIDGVFVTVIGRAHVFAETRQIFDPVDPLRFGLVEGAR
jgi:4-hydroxyproline epimerase